MTEYRCCAILGLSALNRREGYENEDAVNKTLASCKRRMRLGVWVQRKHSPSFMEEMIIVACEASMSTVAPPPPTQNTCLKAGLTQHRKNLPERLMSVKMDWRTTTNVKRKR